MNECADKEIEKEIKLTYEKIKYIEEKISEIKGDLRNIYRLREELMQCNNLKEESF
jgi:5-bromo-4-chloroindolyl phosphate hydrolysis protein